MAGSYGSYGSHMMREQQREEARNKRIQEAAKLAEEQTIPALFGPPLKTANADDPLSQQMKNIFGEFKDVGALLRHNSVIGAIPQPSTPQTPGPPGRGGPFAYTEKPGRSNDPQRNGAYPKCKTEVSERKGVFDQFNQAPPEHDKPHQSRSHDTNQHYEHREHSRSKSHGASHKSRLGNNKYKLKDDVRDSTSSGDSRHHHNHSSDHRPDHRPDHKHHSSSSRERHHSQDSHRHKPSEKSSHPREPPGTVETHSSPQGNGEDTKTFPKPNGLINGVLKSKIKGHHENTLKLHISNEINQPATPANMCVEQIMQEMSFEPALTGIITPKKDLDDGRGFPFPNSKDSATRQLFSKSSDPALMNKQRNMCTKEQNRMLRQDLDVSSDSESEAQVVQPRHRKESLAKVKRSPKHSVTSHSESSSSESSSDSDSSDNEDEQQEAAVPPAVATTEATVSEEKEEGGMDEAGDHEAGEVTKALPQRQSWALKNWKAPEAESSLEEDFLGSQPQEPVDAMDEANARLCNDLIYNNQSLNLPSSISLEDLMNDVDSGKDGDLPGFSHGAGSPDTVTPDRTNKLFGLARTPPDLLSPPSPILSPRQPRSVPAVIETVLKTDVTSPGASSTRSLGSSSRAGDSKSPAKRSRKRSGRSSGSDVKRDLSKNLAKEEVLAPVAVKSEEPPLPAPRLTPSKDGSTHSKSTKSEPSPSKSKSSGSNSRVKSSAKTSGKPSPASGKPSPASLPKKGRSQARSPISHPIVPSSPPSSLSSDSSNSESEAEDAETSFVDVVGLSSPAKVQPCPAKASQPSPAKVVLKLSSPAKAAAMSSPSAKVNGDLTPRRKAGRKLSVAVADVLEEVAESTTELADMAPLLSPIRSEDPALKSPCPPLVAPPPVSQGNAGLTYVDGKPSILVQLDVHLLDLSHLTSGGSSEPSGPATSKDKTDGMNSDANKNQSTDQASRPPPGAKESGVLAQIFKDRQPVQTKIPKRKHSESRSKDDVKRARTESSSQRSGSSHSGQRERTSHTDDLKWDRKPRSSDSQDDGHSSHTEARPSPRSRDRTSPSPWDSHRDHDRYRHKDRNSKDWDAPVSASPHGQSPVPNGHHPAAAHWSAMMTGALPSRRHSPRPPPPPPQFASPDTYLEQAKRLKHQADALNERFPKSVTYVEAVLSFLQCGNAMEQDNVSEPKSIYTMYQDTLTLIRHICKFRGSQDSDSTNEKEKKLAVLSARIQSLLYQKLFKLKRNEVSKFKKILDDFNSKQSNQSKVMAQAPSPYQANWNTRSTGTPSPMSPQPSPAGSVGSVGSVGSGNGDHRVPNGTAPPPLPVNSSASGVTVPQRIHTVTSQYLSHMHNLFQAHELWEQGDTQAAGYREFFGELDHELGTLSLHSSMWDLVRYVQAGLLRLKDT